MKAPANCRLIGRWRIVEADLWDRAHLDLLRPGGLDDHRKAAKSPSSWRPPSKSNTPATRSASTRAGCEERATRPDGAKETAELLDDGTLEIELEHIAEMQTKLSSKRNGTLLQQPAPFDQPSSACSLREAATGESRPILGFYGVRVRPA